MERQKAFDEYVSAFCDLDLVQKKEMVLKEIKETLAVTQKIANDIGNNNELLINKEVLDARDLENCSEDDFYEALFVYIHSIQESLGTIFDKIGEDYYS